MTDEKPKPSIRHDMERMNLSKIRLLGDTDKETKKDYVSKIILETDRGNMTVWCEDRVIESSNFLGFDYEKAKKQKLFLEKFASEYPVLDQLNQLIKKSKKAVPVVFTYWEKESYNPDWRYTVYGNYAKHIHCSQIDRKGEEMTWLSLEREKYAKRKGKDIEIPGHDSHSEKDAGFDEDQADDTDSV